MVNNEIFWNNVMLLLKSKGMSEYVLSERLGKDRLSIYQAIRRNSTPTFDTAMRIAEILGIENTGTLAGTDLGRELRITELKETIRALQDKLANAQAELEKLEMEGTNRV